VNAREPINITNEIIVTPSLCIMHQFEMLCSRKGIVFGSVQSAT
jgi:hypothetical protein